MSVATPHRSAIDIATTEGRRPACCHWERGGLAVTSRAGDDGFTVTHIASGWAVCSRIATIGEARSLAVRLLALGSWDGPRNDVLARFAAEHMRPLLMGVRDMSKKDAAAVSH